MNKLGNAFGVIIPFRQPQPLWYTFLIGAVFATVAYVAETAVWFYGAGILIALLSYGIMVANAVKDMHGPDPEEQARVMVDRWVREGATEKEVLSRQAEVDSVGYETLAKRLAPAMPLNTNGVMMGTGGGLVDLTGKPLGSQIDDGFEMSWETGGTGHALGVSDAYQSPISHSDGMR